MITTRNDTYERIARRSNIRFVTMDDYHIFRKIDLHSLTPNNTEHSNTHDHNKLRNTLFTNLLVTTDLRLEETSNLLADKLATIDHDHDQTQQL